MEYAFILAGLCLASEHLTLKTQPLIHPLFDSSRVAPIQGESYRHILGAIDIPQNAGIQSLDLDTGGSMIARHAARARVAFKAA